MDNRMIKRTLLAIGVSALVSTHALACVEPGSNAFGAVVTNHCPYAVNVSFCFGGCDQAPRGANQPIPPGYSRKLSDTANVQFKFEYCRARAFPDGQGGCTTK
jgi:hypothetical protein